jgi:hypothetical protein
MEAREIAQHRLHIQGIATSPFAAPEEVVRWLGAVQSQEYAAAKWSVGQRTQGVDEAALDQAIADGTILRTHILRPTWHFVLPADIHWMLELTAPRVHAMNAHYDRKLGLDDALFARSNALIAGALEGGNHLTRKEIAALLHRAGITAEGQKLAHLVMRAELDAVICSGAPRGKQHTYALLSERAPQASSLPREEVLAELTRRYFTSHGPATVKDFRWWSSLTAADAQRGLEMVCPELDSFEVGSRTYWFADAPEGPTEVSPTVHLLQGYDEYIVAYGESRDVLDVGAVGSVLPQGKLVFTHAIILDGQLVGRWRRIPKPKVVAVEVQLFRSLDGAEQAALETAVDRYARFAGLPATLL